MKKAEDAVKNRLIDAGRKVRQALLDLLYPQGITCLVCGGVPHVEMKCGLCEACMQTLDVLSQRHQQRESEVPRMIPEELAYLHTAFSYEDPAKKLIRMLKYERVQNAALPLIAAMAMLPSGEEEIIVPVPTTKKRLKARGFNQSLLLAEGIGKQLGMEVCDVLVRIGEQQAQSQLSGKERMNNLNGCMRAVYKIEGKRILLIDDVYTTGATAREAARALYEAGAKSVGMFAAARALTKEEQPKFLHYNRYPKREERQEG